MPGFIFGGGAGTTVTATGTSTARSLSDRFADVTNVKDWGAKGDGTTDDSAAIQACINANNGLIYFPPGTYQINTAINMGASGNSFHVIQGSGINQTVITGSDSVNALFYNTNVSAGNSNLAFRDIKISNGSTTGGACINIVITGEIIIENCHFDGFIGVILGGAPPNGITPGSVNNCTFACSAGTTAPSGSIGAMIGPHVSVYSSSFGWFESAIRTYGVGGVIVGNKFETNGVGISLGPDSTGSSQGAKNKLIAGNTFEANNVHIDLSNGNELTFSNNFLQFGANGPPNGATSTSYGVRVHHAKNILFSVNNVTPGATTADWWISNDISSTTDIYFEQCLGGLTIAGTVIASNLSQQACPNFGSLATTVALLPGNASNNTAGQFTAPSEGMWKIVTDCSNATATPGTTAVGGGSTRCLVVYNNGNWCIN